ncbi:hypothetical protein [Undibacterium sp. TJN19]|uniref:hypothetical protein n=1 Tax=Undibacterium sp. TJN19 TaxID=3413055 RepID=UPI003BF469D6
MFHFQKLSNYGSGTPAVARTVLQGKQILDFFNSTEEQKSETLKILFDLQRHILKCVETRDNVALEIELGRSEYDSYSNQSDNFPQTIRLPGVGDLQSKAENFLQAAKLAIAAAGNLPSPFYGKKFNHVFQKFAKWALDQFGPNDQFTISIQGTQSFVAHIVNMRNAVDHPDTEPGAPLIYTNFRLHEVESKPVLVDPSWSLTGGTITPLLSSFDNIIESLICLGECVLTNLFYKFRRDNNLAIAHIPYEKREPDNPQALYVTFQNLDFKS